MKLDGWTIAAMGLGAVGLGVSLWAFIMAQTATESPPPPPPNVPPSPPTGQRETAMGYEKGVPTTITLIDVGNGKKMREDAGQAFLAMQAAAKQEGVIITVSSGFRSQAEQTYFYNCYITKSCNNGNKAARPGFSNHQNGRAADLNTGSGPAGYISKVYRWLAKNGARYGFKNDVSGEPWHWTYYSSSAAVAGLGFQPLSLL